MKELDFDELDRAVNSLMTNVPKTSEPKKEQDHEQTLTITPTINQDTVPSFSTLGTTLNQLNKSDLPVIATPPVTFTPVTPKLQVVSQAPLAARRGRFMDVVRPPSSVNKSSTMVRPASRLGATVEPAGPSLKDVIPTAVASPSLAPEPVQTPPSAVKEATDWPDPLDVVGKHAQVLLDEPEDVKDEALLTAGTGTANTVEENYTPLTSPFLSDTKVEKRPLGTAIVPNDASFADDSVVEDVVSDDVANDPQVSLANATRPPLPEELSSDIMALEVGANTSALPVAEPMAAVVGSQETSVPAPALQQTASALHGEAPVAIPTPLKVDNVPVTTGPASIPQQYREEPSTGDKENGSIYDTDTYHKPLAHPGKKNSGWMWVVWIVVILLLGAGGGTALYLMHIF